MTLDHLNEQQRAAVTAGPEGPILVNAGPGSGKTKVLTERVAWLVQEQGVSPGNILTMTFSVKAAEEMRVRTKQLLVEQWGEDVWAGTFHKVCRDILQKLSSEDLSPWKHGVKFFNTDRERRKVVKAILHEHNKKLSLEKDVDGGISFAKSWLIAPGRYRSRPENIWDVEPETAKMVDFVYQRYQKQLQIINAMDSGDQLMKTAELFWRNHALRESYGRHIQHVLVDEFQDLDHAQYWLIKLFGYQNNIFVVGDADQAIYSWRGADVRNFEKFRQDFPKTREFNLRENYRSKPTILYPSQTLIQNNSHRKNLALFSRLEKGLQIHLVEAASEFEEADYVAKRISYFGSQDTWSNYAVLYRNGYQKKAFIEAFSREDLPYWVADDDIPLYRYAEVRDMLAYLRLCVYPDDERSFRRVINVPNRGIGPKGLESFFEWMHREGLEISDALRELRNGAEPELLSENKGCIEGFLDFALLLVRDFRSLAMKNELTLLYDGIRRKTGYDDYINQNNEFSRASERKRNLGLLRNHLAGAVEERKTLREFLRESVYGQSFSNRGDNKVPLMTLHGAKGLEFPIVFITGLEDELLPDRRNTEELNKLEEERRLLYVGMTRAEEELYLTWAGTRQDKLGKSRRKNRSVFLNDLKPEDLVSVSTQGAIDQARRPRSVHSSRAEEPVMSRPWTNDEERRLYDHREHVVYRFDHPGGAYCYIGLTANLDQRIAHHCSEPGGQLYNFLSRYKANSVEARQYFRVVDEADGYKQAEEKETGKILTAFLEACDDPGKPFPRNKKSHEIGPDNFQRIRVIAERAHATHGIIMESKRIDEKNRSLERDINRVRRVKNNLQMLCIAMFVIAVFVFLSR